MAAVKKFKCTYDNKKTGEHIEAEAPRFMITVDGKNKSLMIGNDIILATVPKDVSDAELWDKARVNFTTLGRGI